MSAVTLCAARPRPLLSPLRTVWGAPGTPKAHSLTQPAPQHCRHEGRVALCGAVLGAVGCGAASVPPHWTPGAAQS